MNSRPGDINGIAVSSDNAVLPRLSVMEMLPKEREEAVNTVIALIESGSSENSACIRVGLNRATFRHWALKQAAGDKYTRALEALANEQVESLERTIDDMRAGTVSHNEARVEIDARKWIASKLLPKRYGDHSETVHSGTVRLEAVAELADAELERIAKAPKDVG